jgi:hypothetical protein
MSSRSAVAKRRVGTPSAPSSSPPMSVQPRPVLEGVDASLLDIVDHVLTKGVVLTGDLVLGVANIDLIYLRLSAVLCAVDRIVGPSAGSTKHRGRHVDADVTTGIIANLGRPGIAGAARARRRRGP